MSGAYRFWTDPETCIRHWHWFPKVGPAEMVRGAIPACVRGAALALPLLAGPAAGPLLAAPAAPEMPWIGAPGWVQTALPFGPGGYGYGPGFGGEYGYAGGAYTIPEPVSGRPLLGSVLLRVEADRDRYLGGPAIESGVPALEGPSRAGGGYPPLASDTPTDVPEPSALVLLLAGLQPRTKRL